MHLIGELLVDCGVLKEVIEDYGCFLPRPRLISYQLDHNIFHNTILACHNLIATLLSNADILEDPQCLLSHFKTSFTQDYIEFVKDVSFLDVIHAERVVVEGDELAYDCLTNLDERGLVDIIHGEY